MPKSNPEFGGMRVAFAEAAENTYRTAQRRPDCCHGVRLVSLFVRRMRTVTAADCNDTGVALTCILPIPGPFGQHNNLGGVGEDGL